MFRVFRQERVLAGLIMILFLSLSLFETLYGVIKTPSGTWFTFLHNFPEDYFYYLHIMRQGLELKFLVTSRMTPEVYPPQFAIPFFVLLGMLGKIVPMELPVWYLIARVSGGGALMIGIYLLCRMLFHTRRTRLWALLLTLGGSFLPIIQDGVWSAPPHVISWSELDPLMRLTYIPHHLWSKVILVWIVVFLIKTEGPVYHASWKSILAVGILTVVMGFTSPVILVTFGLTLLLWLALEWGMAMRTHQPYPIGKTFLVSSALAGSFFVMLYHWYLSHSVFPWTTYGPPWENNWLMLFSPWEYITMLGGLFFIALIGMVGGWQKSSFRLLLSWIVSGWLLSFLLRRFLPFSGSRYLSGYQWIPIGLLSTYGLEYSATRFGKRKAFVFELMATILFLLSLPSLGISVTNAIARVDGSLSNPRYYVNADLKKTLAYMNTLGAHCTIAAPDWFSTMIPAFSSCRVVSAHRLMTYANDIKVYEMNEFFYSPVPLEVKEQRIKAYGITHVVTLRGITGRDILPLLDYEPDFVSGGVSVYRVR